MKYEDGLTRDRYGKRTDKTGKRDLFFSQWHRKYLSNQCYATDIDFFEYRIVHGEIIPKAFLEVKEAHVKQEKYIKTKNHEAILKIAQKLEIKFIIVLYKKIKKQRAVFYVWEVKSIDELNSYSESKFPEFFKEYSQEEFINFMENL